MAGAKLIADPGESGGGPVVVEWEGGVNSQV